MKKLLLSAVIAMLGLGLSAQEQSVDLSKSSLKWTGKKVTGEHFGYISLKEGTLNVNNDQIVGGTFKIDMSTITVTDIEDPDYNAKLVGHLKSDDFFGVATYSVSKLKIKESSKFKNGEAEVKADLTIKGATHPISFKVKQEGKAYTATITVDRTLYDVRYGSGKFFDGLGDKMIYDDFILEVKIAIR